MTPKTIIPSRSFFMSKPISYTEKIKFIRQFDTVSGGRLTRGKKISITKRYNKYKRLQNLSFIVADRSTIETLSKAGVYTTNKGFFLGTRGKEGVKVLKSGLLYSRVKDRTSYTITMKPREIAKFMDDPEGYIENVIKKKYADIFKRYEKTHRLFIRLVFKWGMGTLDFSIDRLNYYLTNMTDIVDSRTGKIRMSGDDKKAQIASGMIGIKIIFFKIPKANNNGTKKNKKRR